MVLHRQAPRRMLPPRFLVACLFPTALGLIVGAPRHALRRNSALGAGQPGKRDGRRLQVASNRKARFDYHVVRTMEAGIALTGTEVKSCRNNNVNLRDGFARVEGGSVWLHNVDIAPHATTARYFQHEAKAKRRLLLHKAEIRKLDGELADQGSTLVELALCKGKNVRDKRQDIKERDDKRMMQRISKGSY
ncbi:SmpB protein [Aureococcus anophagefferens]|nr:SmpB protein [Aureococcus anophagefferens]